MQNDIDTINAPKHEKQTAINYLLAAGMLKLLKDDKSNKIFYRAINVKEAKNKSTLDKDTQLVLEYIEESQREGIWSKTIERRTDLPQKVVQKCIKVLEQQDLIKPIKSVKYPTRKMYMLFHLTPSVEVTGGVWYTDHEFDSAFVGVLLDHIYNYIAKQSLPPPNKNCSRPLYPRSESSRFPNLSRISGWIKKSGISEVKLKKEDVDMLLRVLEFDGRIEKILSNGLLQMSDDDENDDGKRRKNTGSKRKRKGDDSEADESDGDRKKKRKTNMDDSAEEDERPKGKKKSKGKVDTSDDEEGRKAKSRSSKLTSHDSDSEEDGKRTKKKKSTRSNETDTEAESSGDERYGYAELDATDAYVYRAVRPVMDSTSSETARGSSMFSGSTSAWLGGGNRHLPWAEAPCVRCPQSDFCEEGGPVNAAGCEYLKQWLDPDRIVAQERTRIEGDEAEAAVLIEME
ncbi:hypothetical protein M408DRAFT_7914 [Serendipita vermifera MAFF 305830]|uniref:DNA-directed RNA polymerase III subunit RPC6 n=1 Tax=Serendipita vermifera MAFF 305830 TaxID=933852 RepID=A0A0C3BD25_SERVB|nr:hypothetical protein M408DRAFT_7914 [Serendipita vermifera MAFF 305830]